MRMKFFLRSLCLYLASIIIGFGAAVLILPFLSSTVFSSHLPEAATRAEMNSFVYFYFYRAFMVLIAASFAAILGFFMWENKGLRRATLTLPIWTPLVYSVFYLLFVYK